VWPIARAPWRSLPSQALAWPCPPQASEQFSPNPGNRLPSCSAH
jgi:hypothetical protein